MKCLLAALAALLLVAMPVNAGQVDPYLTLDTPGPYHYAQTVTVTTHGDIPGRPDEKRAKTWIKIACHQGSNNPWTDLVFSPATETQYALPVGLPGYDTWDTTQPADCEIWFGLLGHWPNPGTPYTQFFIHVEV